ncbi:MAG: hypothetical protein ABIK31_00630 [candidate division WOR-3 bacterium]
MKHKKVKYSYNLYCKNCGVELQVKTTDECPNRDILFICCGEMMRRKKS